MLACAIAGAVYIIIQTGFHFTSMKALVMALAYAWGLVLAIYLMGHGLVAIPRTLFRNASTSGRLRRLQAHAPRVHDKLTEAIDILGGVEEQVMQLRRRKSSTSRELEDWIEELVESSSLPESRTLATSGLQPARSGVPTVITERYLAELTRKLKRAQHKKARFVYEWDRLVQQAADLQAILDAATSKRLTFRQQSSSIDKILRITPSLRYQIHVHIIPATRVALGVFFSLASICIVWSEVVKSAEPKLSIVGLTVVHHPRSSRGEIGLAGQAISAVWLFYMCAAALTSMTEVKVWGNRALVRRQTYEESAAWYSYQVAKLTIPLAYNFITFVPPNIYKKTVFYVFLGRLINLTPLGAGFSSFFPTLILVPVCATLFGLYGKAKKVVGLDAFIADDDDEGARTGSGLGGWREGKALIDRELQTGHNDVGLSTRDDFGERRPAAATSHSAPSRSSGPASRDRQPLLVVPEDQDDLGSADPGFFQDFASRVRNTFETAERPAWLLGLGDGIRRPRWMDGPEGASRESSGSASATMGRWFGGRSSTGRIRL